MIEYDLNVYVDGRALPIIRYSELEDAEEVMQHIATHGFAVGNIYYPPHRIEQIFLVWTGEVKNGTGEG